MTRPQMSRGRRVVVYLLLSLIALTLFVVTGEIALRLIYRDGGRTTMGGPGFNNFEYLFAAEGRRGRLDLGPRHAGVPRVMVVGDSITYGQGVRDWTQVWPEVLARKWEQKRGPIEMAVFAVPGNGVPDHALALERFGEQVRPDAIVYQWYVNDLEVAMNRPKNTRVWQQWSLHPYLRSYSFLYYFLDHRFSQLLPQPDRSYVDYVLAEFAPGTPGGAAFERAFDSFARRAKALAPVAVIVMCPQVPFRGTYPLQPVNDRMVGLARQYDMKVIDLTAPFNTFNTHVSVFDAHPNEQAQTVIAEHVLPVLEGALIH